MGRINKGSKGKRKEKKIKDNSFESNWKSKKKRTDLMDFVLLF